ncbi:MAG: type I-E CRISPR-associated protein Cas7/Cse4/CasC [Deferrisomatales bacterium]|nr:type I-E CRISPR-associated protein Cas7/Cse4/CasC [Deferrisomatales bacterium]
MSTFIQLHLLTSYPPANLNRDDLGRPKTAMMGGAKRLRISSQSLKRAWRTSDALREALSGHLGVRTKRLGTCVFRALQTGEELSDLVREALPPFPQPPAGSSRLAEAEARDLAWSIAAAFVDKPRKEGEEPDDEEMEAEDEEKPDAKKGKKKGKKDESKSNVSRDTLMSEQLVFCSTLEIQAIANLVKRVLKDRKLPAQEEIKNLAKDRHTDADLAMFGRMLAASPAKNVEAAAQVAHAITVHKVAVEDDYFTAVDDLNSGAEDVGAGHIGETEFAAGLFYLYVCIDRDLLLENLQDEKDLTRRTLKALAEAAATVAPTGKQNSFASRAYASYILAEKGTRQPRSLSVAFLKPVTGQDMLGGAIKVLEDTRVNMDKVYGALSDVPPCVMNAATGEGSLAELLDFVAEPLPEKKDPA